MSRKLLLLFFAALGAGSALAQDYGPALYSPPPGKSIPTARPFNYPNPFGQATDCGMVMGGVCFVFNSDIAGSVTLEIFDVTGTRIRKIEFLTSVTAHQDSVIQWNGRNAAGNHVPNGVYIYRIVVTDPADTTHTVAFRGKCYKFLYPGDVP